MAKKNGLGRGLSALLPDVEEVVSSLDAAPGEAVAQIPLGDIDPNRDQPRKRFDEEALRALADSIRHSGVISPILVAKSGARYTIIAGERRWRAARLAGLATIPAIVREWDDVKRREAALVENIQRENLNPIEEAQGIRTLMRECALTQEAVAERLGRSRPAVANLLRLLTLPQPIQDAVADGSLSAGHARALAGVSDPERQAALFSAALDGGWTVRRLETAAQAAPAQKRPRREAAELPPEYAELAERLRAATGMRVTIEGTRRGGRVVLQYADEEDLQRLWELTER